MAESKSNANANANAKATGDGRRPKGISVTLRQPDWETRVEQAMDITWGVDGGPSTGRMHHRTACPPAPSVLSNTTRRDHLVFQYEAQVPLQLDIIFGSPGSTVHQKVGSASLAPVLEKLARFYRT